MFKEIEVGDFNGEVDKTAQANNFLFKLILWPPFTTDSSSVVGHLPKKKSLNAMQLFS